MEHRLAYSQLDSHLTVWGVLARAERGLTVRAYPRWNQAVEAAEQAPAVAVPTPRGEVITVSRPLVYHHPEDGWCVSAMGQAIPLNTVD